MQSRGARPAHRELGGESTGTKFADFSVLDTALFEAYFNSDQAGTTDFDIASTGRITTSDVPLPTPEPATVLVARVNQSDG